ncbi:hypothetical protein O181_077978 [Austropuccinia psidii MF-1]|uniref:Armadillo repeat-containing protein 8 n=1 Tax=Austropuccinia psidii MF-1 TaxID=1389203 RepID=A0A9Q3FDU4_9BASI|nr:hypothetical protein [Austropuccinia psidii MF-1]
MLSIFISLFLSSILESSDLDLISIHLKIEAAAIVGLLCIPQDQTVHALLSARLPTVIIDSITNLLIKTPIQSILSSLSSTRQIQHHLLQTLLRTLASIYSIIQDVSSIRKWGYMTKSPERLHQPQTNSIKNQSNFYHDLNQNDIDQEDHNHNHNNLNLDMKGKAKAFLDLSEEMPINTLLPLNLEIDQSETLTQHLWLTSKPNQLKETCEHFKTSLLKFLVSQNSLIALILTITPNSNSSNLLQSVQLPLCSIADLVVPCFQLIWLLCKDTSRQLWLVKKLINAHDPITNQDSCLKALTQCLRFWLNSHHDQAIEYSTRLIGALLSIHEPLHYSQDQQILEYLDQLIWGKTYPEDDGSRKLQNWGIGWVLLTCRTHEASPALRSALATSIIGLVKPFPDIRLRILLLQIADAIPLINNPLHSITVRSEATYALAHAVTISEALQFEATRSGVIPVLKKLLDKASEQPIPYPTPSIVTQNAMLRESAYLALASLMSTLDAPRQEVIDLDLLPIIVKSLNDESIFVRAAACQCCRALSRAISVLRTKLADEGAGSRLFELAFGIDQSNVSLGETLVDEDEDEDAVEIQLKIVAMGALCNLVLDFSPMKNEVLNRQGVEKFVKLLKLTKYQSLRESALWGLKNITFSSPTQLKLKVISNLGWDEIIKLLEDKNPSIQENVISLLRNVACGEIVDIDIVFRQLSSDNRLADLLDDRLSSEAPSMSSIGNGLRESIMLQTIYTISNIATGDEVHKNFLMNRYRTMKSVYDLMSHPNPEIQIGAIWCIINLTYFDEKSKSRVINRTINLFEELGVIKKLKELINDDNNRIDVSERAECALSQIIKKRRY